MPVVDMQLQANKQHDLRVQWVTYLSNFERKIVVEHFCFSLEKVDNVLHWMGKRKS